MFVKPSVSAISKQIESHQKHREGRKADINQSYFTSLGIISTPLGHDTIANFGHRRRKVFSQEFVRSYR